MRVFAALLLDAYRELNSKKLFWVILALSGFVVLTYGSIGFDDTGMSLFFGLKHIENDMLTRDSFLSRILYRSIFSTFMLGIWLTWIATILALISTTTIFPDFIASGAIDIVLAKPISRPRLFIFKYLAGLLFVTLQISIFCLGVFLCLGLRLNDWQWLIFAAVPLVVVFYSYLFSVNVLVGVWSRSALTALLVTLLMWTSLWGVNAAETIVNMFKMQIVLEIEEHDEEITGLERQLETLEATGEAPAPTARENVRIRLETLRSDRDEMQSTIDKIERWHRPVRVVQAILPKTGETIGLADRWLRRDTDINIMDILTGGVTRDESGAFARGRSQDEDREVERRLEDQMESRSEFYVIGTSLLFEAVVLALACWIFVRRDY